MNQIEVWDYYLHGNHRASIKVPRKIREFAPPPDFRMSTVCDGIFISDFDWYNGPFDSLPQEMKDTCRPCEEMSGFSESFWENAAFARPADTPIVVEALK